MIIALNNKCNLTKQDFLKYQEELGRISTNNKLILCPTFLNIGHYNLENVELGAQNVSSKEPGATTGEVAAIQLKEEQVKYCIVGHSERRNYQHETNEEINQKIIKLLDKNIIPILCVGETKEEREKHLEKGIIEKELKIALQQLNQEQKEKIIIAYEPIWSIGTGIIPTNDEIKEMIKNIKEILPNNKVLYGGSANEENIVLLREINEIDGYLLGGLSLKPEKLKIFIEKLEK